MSAAMEVSFRESVLPWAGSFEDDVRFRRVLRIVWIVCAVLCLCEIFMPIVTPDRSKQEELPARLTAMVLENAKEPLPTPKPEVQTPTELPKNEVNKADQPPEKVIPKLKPVPEARVPVPNKPPGEVDAARRKAAGVGLMAMANDIAEIHGAPMAVQLAPVKQGPGVGTGTGVGVGAGNEAGVPVRALITSNAAGGSGGINTGSYSRNTGGGGLAGRSTTLVAGVLGGGGGGGAGGASPGSAGNAPAGGTLHRSGSGKASRSIEEIKLVFEKNKGAIYAIYNRALREDPGLQGKVVLELKIAPSGSVIDCRIVSSELKTPDLENKLLARIHQFDFGAEDVDQMVVTWPVDFLPS